MKKNQNTELLGRTGVYPVSIEPLTFEHWAKSPEAVKERKRLRKEIGTYRIILAVDRLDPVKGIEKRLLCFENFLEQHPQWRKYVSMMQITVPSRTHVPEYIDLKQKIDELVKRINSRFSEDDWIPIIYEYKRYEQNNLCAYYSEADICLITSLGDGMNLVAKEYISSQIDNVGVLIVSKFCGVTEDFKEAIIIDPNNIDDSVKAIKHALEMPLSERQNHCQTMRQHVHTHTANKWGKSFLNDLVNKS